MASSRTAEQYSRRADEIRTLAARVIDSGARNGLLALAEKYDLQANAAPDSLDSDARSARRTAVA